MEPALTTRGPWPTATKQTPDGDSKLSKASDSVEGDQVREKTDAQTEQLQQLHWSQQQQLDREQLNQLKAFKNQLMNDVITQLSPRSGPQEDIVGTGQRYSCFDTHQLSLSLEEAGHLLSPLFTHPIHHSAAPPGLFTPIRLPTSITAINHVSPSSSPPRSSLATTTPSRTNPPVTTELCASNLYSTPPQAPLNQHTLQVHLPERSQVALPSTLSPDLSVVCPQLPVPSSSPHSTPPTITCTPGPILPAGTANSHSQQLSISRTSPHTVGHTISPTARSTMPLPLPQNTQGTPNTHSAVKTTLIEKHARHVEDLKQYYESKLEELQRELNLSSEEKPLTSPLSHAKSPDCESNERLQSSIATRLQYANLPSPGLSATERAHKRLQAENDRLKAECTNLKIKLKQHDIVNQALEDQIKKQDHYLLEWQSQAEAASRTIGVLQDKLEATRTQLHQQDSIVEQLQADLQVSVGEIQFWKEQQIQAEEKYQQLCGKFEELKKKNISLETTQSSLRGELSGAQRDVGQMEAAIRTHLTQEQEYKNTIHKYGERIRHLEHVNNRLHGQATHYTLGTAPNTPDDDKLHHCSQPSSPTPSRPPNQISPLTTTPITSAHPHSLPLPSPHSRAPADSSNSSSLSRRKWLQPSDPGLILGTPPDSPATVRAPRCTQWTTTSPPHRNHAHHSNITSSEMTSSPLLQSTGQTIAQQSSDSGSSDEGEDSLTKQGYINADRHRHTSTGGKDDWRLVHTTLSAIQNGKIRTDSTHRGQPKKASERETIQMRVERSLRVVAAAEEKLVELQKEKEKLESVLQRAPRQGGRVTKHSKQAQLDTERRLEAVIQEIGSVRMTLRNHHALRK